MKKLMVVAMLAVTLLANSLDVMAVQRSRRRTADQYSSRQYGYSRNNDYYERRDDRSVWDRHRDKITTAAGAAGGAAVGAAVGGKKGAIIGGLAGGIGSAIYTYKIRKKDRRY